MKNILLIDADSLCYIGRHKEQSIQELITTVEERIDSIIAFAEADYVVLFISEGKYFRHYVDSNYKGNRDYNASPQIYARTIKAFLKAKYNAVSHKGVEADDLCAYWYKNLNSLLLGSSQLDVFKDYNVILAAIDKDLLGSIEGTHINYKHGLDLVKTDKEEAIYNFWVQMITGDPGDNIKGIEGKGKAAAIKLYQYVGIEDPENTDLYHELCLSAYIKKYGTNKGILEFQKNYRLLHLLDTNEDFKLENLEVPKFPQLIEI